MLRIGIVSDFPVIRLGLRVAVEATGARVTFEGAADPKSVGEAACCCDVMVVDVGTTPGQTSLVICKGMTEDARRAVPIGVECCGFRSVTLRALVDAGLAGCVSLDDGVGPLGACLTSAVQGESFFQFPRSIRSVASRLDVSERDIEMLSLMSAGLTYKEVADELQCGESTVKHHVERLRARLCFRTQFQLGAWARRCCLVSGTPGEGMR